MGVDNKKGGYNVMKLGSVLQRLRIEQGISQKELSQGLCSVATLSRIEAGERLPDQILFDSLISRLGKDSTKWELILKENDKRLLYKRNYIDYLIWAEEWEQLEEELGKYKDFRGVVKHLQEQYICLIQAILCKERKQYEKALQYCYEGLEKTNVTINSSSLRIEGRLSRNELQLLCFIGELLIYKNNPEFQLYSYWKELLEYIEKFCTDKTYYLSFFIQVSYYLSKITYKQQYEESIGYFNKGMQKIRDERTIYYLKEYIELLKIFRETDNSILSELSTKDIDILLITLKEWKDNSKKIKEKERYMKSNNSIYTINEIIKNTRYVVGKTQEDMISVDEEGRAMGDQSNLSKIENKKRNPRKRTQKIYLEQLGLEGKEENFYLSIIGEDFEIQEIRWNIDQAIAMHNMSEANMLLSHLKEKIDISNVRNKQYIKEIELLIKSEIEVMSCEKRIAEICNILSLTIKDVDKILGQEKIRGFLTREELYLFMNIGCAYHDSGDYKKAIDYYEKLEQYFYEYYPLSSGKIYKTLLYNLSQVYGLTGEYEKSMEKSRICIFMDMLDSETNIYCQAVFNIGWCYGRMMLEKKDCLQKQQYKKMCLKMFEQSYLLAKYYKYKIVENAICEKIKVWKLEDKFISLLEEIHR